MSIQLIYSAGIIYGEVCVIVKVSSGYIFDVVPVVLEATKYSLRTNNVPVYFDFNAAKVRLTPNMTTQQLTDAWSLAYADANKLLPPLI